MHNLDIFIGTHKTFEPKVSNNCYKIVVGNHSIENKSNLELIECGSKGDVLDDKFYSEIYMLEDLSQNYAFQEYVGFCHYRKYFSFMDNIPNLEEMFSKYEIITAKPIIFRNTVRQQYAKCHNIEDLDIVSGIIGELYPNYADTWNDFLDGHLLFPYNMFIMKSEEFKEYIEFVKKILDKYVEIVGTDIYQRIESNKEKYLKTFSPNNTIEYQYRIGGYLAERLTSVWIMHKHKKIMTCRVKITEQKYK